MTLYTGTRVVAFASAEEIVAGEEYAKVIGPEQLLAAFASLPAANNDAAAAGVGVSIGHLYRTDADPSVICVRIA